MRNLSLRFLMFPVMLCLLTAISLPAVAADMTKLTIKVIDEKGKPVDRANVRVVFKQGRKKVNLKKIVHSWELKTGQDGTASIPAIPKGDILIQVTGKYYQSFGDTLTIDEDERTIDVTLKPPQKQYSVHGDLKQ